MAAPRLHALLSSWRTLAVEIAVRAVAVAMMPSKYAGREVAWWACLSVVAIDIVLLIASFVAVVWGMFSSGDRKH